LVLDLAAVVAAFVTARAAERCSLLNPRMPREKIVAQEFRLAMRRILRGASENRAGAACLAGP
jgi:hypothetical protein